MKRGMSAGIVGTLLSAALVSAESGLSLSSIWQRILDFGDLTFLGMGDGVVVAAFMRILVWILIFTIFFTVINAFGRTRSSTVLGFFSRTQAIVVAGVLATMCAVFMPSSVLLATGAGWATAVSLILIGLPVAGVAAALYYWPPSRVNNRWTYLMKLLMCLLLFWILLAMKYHLARMA
jgi:hypothetical protein